MKTRAVTALLDLTAEAGSTQSVQSYHAELLARLARVFPCDVLVFNEFRVQAAAVRPGAPRPAPRISCAITPPLEPTGAVSLALLDVFQRHLSAHPLIRLQAAGDTHARRLSDAVSLRSFRHGSLYGEFFRPAEIAHQLALGLDGPPGLLVGFWANRSRQDFSAEDLVLADLLRPRLGAAEMTVRRVAARATLTEREREVLDIVASGATNAVVAETLVVSPGTVKKHLDNIYAKLGVQSRAAAAQRAGVHDKGPLRA